MKRDSYWDSLKFVFIFIVVLIHCIGSYKPSGGINQALYNFGCSFIMPSFLFVSGMFSHIKDREKYKRGILRIFETYAVFQLIRAIISMSVSGNITFKSIAAIIVFPKYTLWFLLSLIIMRLIVYFMPERILRDNPIRIILICFLISLFGGFFPINSHFAIQETMAFLPFFFMGYYAKNIQVKQYIARIPPLLALGVLISVFMIIYFNFNYNLNFILLGHRSYWATAAYSPLLLCFSRLVFLLSAIVLGSMVMRLVMVSPSFTKWGRITLFIYIYHSLLIEIFRFCIRNGYLPQNEWICFVMPVIITIGLILISNNRFLNILLNPVSYIQENVGKSRNGMKC